MNHGSTVSVLVPELRSLNGNLLEALMSLLFLAGQLCLPSIPYTAAIFRAINFIKSAVLTSVAEISTGDTSK